MKKILLALLVLIIAVPAMGTVKVKIRRVTDDPPTAVVPNKVNIGYTYTAPGASLRALAIKATVGKVAYVVGSATRVGTDYYVTPSNITFTVVDGNTVINTLGLPVVLETTGGCVLETASLYGAGDPGGHTSAPAADANVVQLTLDCTKVANNSDPCYYGTVDVSISAIQADAAKRGGIVLEDGNAVTPIINPSTYLPPKLSFCRATHQCWLCPGQPSGDINGDGSVSAADLALLQLAYGTRRTPLPASPRGTGAGKYNCCADLDHNGSVSASDLALLQLNYGTTGMGTCKATAPAGFPARTCP